MNNATHLTISDIPFPIHPGKIRPEWAEQAMEKGYTVVARIIDRLHLALRCHHCGAIEKVRLYTLMSAQPLCHSCIKKDRCLDAQTAGLTYIRRCEKSRHHAIYRAACGHELRRQLELVKRVGSGSTGLRCSICHHATEAAEAVAQGWTLIGPDPEGSVHYRQYRHTDCGHEQRVVRANVQTGRLSCGGCGEQWSAAPSHLYLMRFTLPNSRNVVKLGYSNNPESRLHHQLLKDRAMPCAILRKVPVPSGQIAIRLEKALHRKLRDDHPNAVLDPEIYGNQIKVKSEIYDSDLTDVIMAELDAIAARPDVTAS